MNDEKPKLTFYGNDSQEHRNLERQLRARGYEVQLITCGRDEPVMLSSTKNMYLGLRDICDMFGIHPRG